MAALFAKMNHLDRLFIVLPLLYACDNFIQLYVMRILFYEYQVLGFFISVVRGLGLVLPQYDNHLPSASRH